MNWLLERLAKNFDFLPYKKRIIAGGTALVLGWVEIGMANLPPGLQLPAPPMAAIEETLTWLFACATALFIYGGLAALARAKLNEGD